MIHFLKGLSASCVEKGFEWCRAGAGDPPGGCDPRSWLQRGLERGRRLGQILEAVLTALLMDCRSGERKEGVTDDS